MRLYRWGGDFKKVSFSYQFEKIVASRLETGVLDCFSLDCLTKVLSGEVSHIEDLASAELALRAIVFHDFIQEVTPSVKIQVIGPEGSPFVYNETPKTADRTILSEILNASNYKTMICGIDQLIAFSDARFGANYIKSHEKRRKKRQRRGAHLNNGIGSPSFSLDVETAPIERVADNRDDFFKRSLRDGSPAIKRFLMPLSESGYAVYLGAAPIRRRFEKLHNYNASEFFDVLDADWEALNHKLRRVLQVPVPLFLSIILTRAVNRADLAKEILALKQEFAAARKQLWELFDEADFRIYDTKVSARILADIEKAAASVIPKALAANDFWFPIRFDFMGRIREFTGLGMLQDLGTFLTAALANQCIRVDAAVLTSKCLQTTELRGLLLKTLSESEIGALAESIDEDGD